MLSPRCTASGLATSWSSISTAYLMDAGALGGKAVDDAAPAITFGIREAALTRPGGSEIAARLVAGLTDAVARVLGEQTRGGTSVELVATPEGRTGIGGTISE